MVMSTLLALASAMLFALTTNLQRAAASSVPSEGSGPLHLLRRLAVDRRWLLGSLIGLAALGLHVLSLAGASVMVVQSVMAIGLVIALYVEAVREHRPLRWNEVVGAGLVIAGVGTVVAIGEPARHPADGDLWTTLVCGAVVLVTVAVVLRSRRGVGTRWEARLLAASAGACFAVDAVFLQRITTVFHGGFDLAGAVIGPAGFALASMIGTVAMHRAYQVAPLRSVQPALVAAEPVTAFLIGVTVLHEGVRGGALGYLAMLGGLVAITAGIFVGLVLRNRERSAGEDAGTDLEGTVLAIHPATATRVEVAA